MRARDFGTASSAKRGRNPRWPFVPVIRYSYDGPNGVKSHQVRGKAFATAAEAEAHAEKCISAMKRRHAEMLADPRQRAMREWYGLPREI